MYNVSTQQFTGPLDLLLQLVEKNNLEITEISLAQVTQDYMNHIGIKSKSLLPTLELETEEQEEILDLENRLQLYKIYKEQGMKMHEVWNKHFYLFTRLPWKDTEVKFSPSKNISISSLSQSFKKVLESFEEEIPLEEKRIKELVQKLTQEKDYSLEELVPDKNKRVELILTFLAVLYLVKENIIKIKQNKNFGSIWISN